MEHNAATSGGYAEQSPLQRLSSAVNSRTVRFFDGLGRFVACRPYYVIFLSVILTCACGVAMVGLFTNERDGEDLFSPRNAPARGDWSYLRETFGNAPTEVRLFVTRSGELNDDPDCSKSNLLANSSDAKNVLLDYMDLYEKIESQTIVYHGEVHTLTDVCLKPSQDIGACETRSLLDIWDYNRYRLEADEDVLATIQAAIQAGHIQGRFGGPISPSYVLGRNKEENECKGHVEAFHMTFSLQNKEETVDGLSFDPESVAWTVKLVETMTQDWKSNNGLVAHVSNIELIDRESNKVINRDSLRLYIGFGFVFAFTHWVLFKDSPVFCKSHLAPVSVVSVAMSIITAFGLAQLMGVTYNPLVQSLVFILLGLGMDDTFVIMGAYHSTSVHQSVEDRMAETMARAGSSILVTSLTDMVAFVVGTYTQLPALQAFSIYAFLGVMFDFIYQVTFFAAFVVLEARRENRALNGAPWLGLQFGCAPTQFDTTIPSFKVPKLQYIDKHMGTIHEEVPLSIVNGKNWRRRIFWCKETDIDPNAPSLATKVVGEWLPKVTLHPVGSTVVLLIEATLLAVAIYGCTRAKMDFRFREWFVPEDSQLKNAFEVEKTYFTGNQQPFFVVTKIPTDGRDFFYHQDDYLELIETIRHDPYVSELPPVMTWYESFSAWLVDEGSPFRDDVVKLTGRAPNATAFTDWVRYFVTQHPLGKIYNNSVIFGLNGIESTTFVAHTLDIKDGPFAVATVDSLRGAVAKAAPVLDPIAYSKAFFLYDGFKVITWETIRNVLMAGGAVFTITTVVLADVRASTIVTLMIGLTDVVVFGSLWYVGLTFNTVTSINMVLAVGLTIDYSAHIAHSFLSLKGTKEERARGALYHIGGEVFAGAFSTWLAVLFMGAAEHYIFKVFFRMFFTIIATGAWHGIVVLPIVLKTFGPRSYGATSTSMV